MMNAQISQKWFWRSHENGLIKAIPNDKPQLMSEFCVKPFLTLLPKPLLTELSTVFIIGVVQRNLKDY